jgi:AraC family transcriptional regulator
VAQLHAAKQLLTANTDETVLIADVARAYGLSRQYFTKAFKAATGVTPHRWLPRYRVETATQLLGTTSLPIAESRSSAALPIEAIFTRVFTQLAGSSPGNWRKQGTRRRDRERL